MGHIPAGLYDVIGDTIYEQFRDLLQKRFEGLRHSVHRQAGFEMAYADKLFGAFQRFHRHGGHHFSRLAHRGDAVAYGHEALVH